MTTYRTSSRSNLNKHIETLPIIEEKLHTHPIYPESGHHTESIDYLCSLILYRKHATLVSSRLYRLFF